MGSARVRHPPSRHLHHVTYKTNNPPAHAGEPVPALKSPFAPPFSYSITKRKEEREEKRGRKESMGDSDRQFGELCLRTAWLFQAVAALPTLLWLGALSYSSLFNWYEVNWWLYDFMYALRPTLPCSSLLCGAALTKQYVQCQFLEYALRCFYSVYSFSPAQS